MFVLLEKKKKKRQMVDQVQQEPYTRVGWSGTRREVSETQRPRKTQSSIAKVKEAKMKGLGLISRVREHLTFSTQLSKQHLDYLRVWEIRNTMLHICM